MSSCVSEAARCHFGCHFGVICTAIHPAISVSFRCHLGVCALPPYPYVPTPLQAGRCTHCGQGVDRCVNPTSSLGPRDLKRPASGAPLNTYEIGRDCDKPRHPPAANIVARLRSPAVTPHVTPDARFWVSAPFGPASAVSPGRRSRGSFGQGGAPLRPRGHQKPYFLSGQDSRLSGPTNEDTKAASDPIHQPVECEAPGRFVGSTHPGYEGMSND